MSGYARLGALVACVTALGLLGLASSALASTGEITTAVANSEGTEAEIAGSVNWTGCTHSVPWPMKPPRPRPIVEWPGEPESPEKVWPPPYCAWIPFATLGPGTAASDCSVPGRRYPDSLGDGIVLIWSGSERRDLGNEDFEVPGIPLGADSGRLVCLSVIEIAPSRAFACPAYVGFECPPFMMAHFPLSMDSALVEPETPPQRPPPERPVDPPGSGGSTPPASGKARKCVKRAKGAQRPRARHCKRHGHAGSQKP